MDKNESTKRSTKGNISGRKKMTDGTLEMQEGMEGSIQQRG